MKNVNLQKYLTVGLLALSAVLLLIGTFYYAAVAPSIVPTNHIDGTFQTASAMFRLNDGQIPGANFFPYLGVGPLLFIFPLFKLFGATVVASATAARYVILLTAMISSATMISSIWKVRPGKSLLIGGLGFMTIIMTAALTRFPVADWFYFAVEPGASLRPLRAALPYFVLLVYFAIRAARWADKKWWFRPVALGIVIGWSALWSNDFAYITAVALLGLIIVDNLKSERRWLSLGTLVGTAAATFALIGNVVTGFNLIDLMKYNFVDVSGDQWWYFGPWSDQARIWSIADLPKILAQDNLLPLLFVIGLLIYWLVRKSEQAMYLGWLGLVLFGGGLVAAVGGHLDLFYFGAFHYWAYVAMILLAARVAIFLLSRRTMRVKGEKPKGKQAVAIKVLAWPIGAVIAASYVLATAADNYARIHDIEVSDPSVSYSSQLGGYVQFDWKSYLDFANANADKKIVEEYWGVWSAALNKQAPFRVDSVIHSLGAERQVSDSNFGNPDLIVTSSEDALWQGWSFSYNYWFYKHLMHGWRVVYQSPLTLVWAKDTGPSSIESSQVACRVNADKSITYESTAPGLYQLTVDYRVDNPGRSLVMLKNNIPKTGDDGLYVSMNLKANQMTLPAYSPMGSSTTLPIKVMGAGVGNLVVRGCKAEVLPQYVTEVFTSQTPIDNATFYSAPDATFGGNGVSLNSAKMLMPASAGNWFKFTDGGTVHLPDGTSRTIKSHAVVGGKLYVYLDGQPFSLPAGVYPPSLTVTR